MKEEALSRLTSVEKAVKNTTIQLYSVTVVFLTAFSTRVSVLSSKIHNVDDTLQERKL